MASKTTKHSILLNKPTRSSTNIIIHREVLVSSLVTTPFRKGVVMHKAIIISYLVVNKETYHIPTIL